MMNKLNKKETIMKKILSFISFVVCLFLATTSFAAGSFAEVRADTNQITSSGSMWVDYQFGRPGVYANWFDDFFEYTAGDWTITTVETGSGNATEQLVDFANGVLRITTDNTDAGGDLDSLQLGAESFLPASTKDIYCELRVSMTGTVAGTALTYGLVVTDTTAFAHTDGIVFKKDDGDAALDFSTTASSTASTDAAIATVVSGTYMKLGFRVKGTTSVEYWVNDSQVGEFSTNIPTTEMRPTIYIANTGDTVSTYYTDVDYFTCAQER